MATIAERILHRMRDRDLSYGDLSRMTGISKAMLQRYATGDTQKIPMNKLPIIADALGTTPAELLGWVEEVERFEVSDEEKNLIILYREADPVVQKIALELLQNHPKI